MLLIQAVDEPFIKALKEDYIMYGRRTPYNMIVHLRTNKSKVTNKEKVQLKKEIFIKWKQPQALSAYFKQIKKARKQMAKWSIKVLDDDIVIHIVHQMYYSDWFSKETMMTWEEMQDRQNMGQMPDFL